MKDIPSVHSIFLIFCTVFAGCATTSITSVPDPTYAGKPFHKIAVFADTTDLEARGVTEHALAGDFADDGVPALEWLKLYPSYWKYSDSTADSILAANGVDGFLKISFLGEGGTYVNPTLKIQATLYDDSNWHIAWLASTTSTLTGRSDFVTPFSTYIASFAKKVVEKLNADGMVKEVIKY